MLPFRAIFNLVAWNAMIQTWEMWKYRSDKRQAVESCIQRAVAVGKLCSRPLCGGLFWLLRQDAVDRWLLLSPPICLTFHSGRWLFRCERAQKAPCFLSSVLIMNTTSQFPQDWPDCHVSWVLVLKARPRRAVVFLSPANTRPCSHTNIHTLERNEQGLLSVYHRCDSLYSVLGIWTQSKPQVLNVAV